MHFHTLQGPAWETRCRLHRVLPYLQSIHYPTPLGTFGSSSAALRIASARNPRDGTIGDGWLLSAGTDRPTATSLTYMHMSVRLSNVVAYSIKSVISTCSVA